VDAAVQQARAEVLLQRGRPGAEVRERPEGEEDE